MLKIKRKLVVVPSVLLWEKVAQDFAASQPWQKLRRNLLMIIQIIALILLVLLLARPFIKYNQTLGSRIAVLIDVSPSMLATDVQPSRLAEASNKASELVNALQRSEQMMIMAVGSNAKLISGFTSDKRELFQAISRLRTERGGSAEFSSALQLVKSINKNANVSVHIITDGRVPELPSELLEGVSIRYTKIGNKKNNVGITSAAYSFNELTQSAEIFVSMNNYNDELVTLDLDLYHGEDIIDTRSVTINGNSQTDLAFGSLKVGQNDYSPYKLKLDSKDAFELDNVVYIIPTPPQPIEILLKSDNFILNKVLASNPQFKVSVGEEIPQDLAEKYHLAIIEGQLSKSLILPKGNYLLINVSDNPYLPLSLGNAIEQFRIVEYQQNSPMFRFVNLRDVRFSSGYSTTLRTFGRSLAEGPEGPVIAEGINKGHRIVHFAFSLDKTDLPLRASFPIMINNICRYLAQQGGESAKASLHTQYRIGDRVERAVPPSVNKVVIIAPDGTKSDVLTQNNTFTFSGIKQTGLYKVMLLDNNNRRLDSTPGIPIKLKNKQSNYQPDDKKVRETYLIAALPFAVNVTDVEESRIEPVDHLGKERNKIISSGSLLTNKEFTKLLIFILLALISFEWVLYHRRLA